MAISVGDLVARLRLDATGFSRALQTNQAKLQDFGAAADVVGRKLTRRLTLPLVAAGGASVTMAARFEKSMTKIITLVGVAERQVNQWNKAVLDMSKQTGRGPKELADALFVVTSAGLRGAESLQVLEAAAKASAVGLGDTAGIARAVTSAVQAYGQENLNATRATEIMMATVREGNLEASRLAGSLGRVIGVAANLGISFENVGAFLATFTRLGVSAEEAVTALRSTLTTLTGATREGRVALERAGLSLEYLRQVARERGLPEALRMIVEAFGDNVEQLRLVIPNIRALAGVMGTAGAQGEDFAKILDSINESAGIVEEGFERVQKTTAFMFDQMKANASALAITIGQQLLPIVNRLLGAVTTLANKLSGLNPLWVELGISVGIVLAALGPLTIGLGALATALSTVALALGTTLLPVLTTVAPYLIVGGILATGLTWLAVHFLGAKDAADEFAGSLDKVEGSAEDLRQRQAELTDELKRLQHGAEKGRTEALRNKWKREAEAVFTELMQVTSALQKMEDEAASATTTTVNGLEDVAGAAEKATQKLQYMFAAMEAQTTGGIQRRFRETWLAFLGSDAGAQYRRTSGTRPGMVRSIKPGFQPLGLGPVSPHLNASAERLQEFHDNLKKATVQTNSFGEAMSDTLRRLVDPTMMASAVVGTALGGFITSGIGMVMDKLNIGGLSEWGKAVRENTRALKEFVNSISGQMSLFEAALSIYDLPEDPAGRLQTLVDAMIDAIGAGSHVRAGQAVWKGLWDDIGMPPADVSTKAGRDALEAWIKRAFERFRADPLAFRYFRDITGEQFVQLLVQMESLTDEVDSTTDALQAMQRELSNVPRGFKLALATYHADTGAFGGVPLVNTMGGGGEGPVTGLGGGAGGGIVIGEVHIHQQPGQTGAELWEEMEREARRKEAAGGTSRLSLARLQR